MEQKPQIEIRGLCKDYPIPGGEVHALSNISLTIDKGDIYGIIGMSGAGKSTLIRCLNRLDTPTDGQIFIDGENILAMSKQQLRQTRRRMALLFSMLDYLGIERERTRVEWVSAAEGAKFAATMNDFAAKVASLGENKRLEDLRCRK